MHKEVHCILQIYLLMLKMQFFFLAFNFEISDLQKKIIKMQFFFLAFNFEISDLQKKIIKITWQIPIHPFICTLQMLRSFSTVILGTQ